MREFLVQALGWLKERELASTWADVSGFLIAVVGFWATLVSVRKSKNAALKAQEAAQDTVRVVATENQDHETTYIAYLLNGNGEVADKFTDEDLDVDQFGQVGEHWFKTLKDLYVLALRHARGADKVLNEILHEIDDGGTTLQPFVSSSIDYPEVELPRR